MKTITQYREDIKSLMKKLGDIDAKCVAENRDMTVSEDAIKNELLDEVDRLQKLVTTMDRQGNAAAELKKPASGICCAAFSAALFNH